jgi:uncharacterized repeat protein (TIGR01451 family)
MGSVRVILAPMEAFRTLRRRARFLGGALVSLTIVVLSLASNTQVAEALTSCNATIYAANLGGALYAFTPPSAAAASVPGAPANFFTIARGPYTGNVYNVSSGVPATLTSYNVTTNTQATVGTFGNADVLFANGFNSDGVGYVMSTTQVWSYTDAPTPVIAFVGTPQTSSGPAISSFNGGDIAIDGSNQGWVVESNANGTPFSYLYKVAWGNPTVLTQVAQVTLGGTNYAVGDLYSLAFGKDGNLYAAAYNSAQLYTINQSTAAMTLVGGQGSQLADFASCPFLPSVSLAKTGPTQSSAGELMAYTIQVSNAPSSFVSASGIPLSDTVPVGITVLRATGGATCAVPAVGAPTGSGTPVTTTASVPAGSSATLTIVGRNATLPIGTTTNTAQTTVNGNVISASTNATILASDVVKTVQNITQGTAATTTSNNGNPSDVLEFVLTYKNNTNYALTGFVLSDNLPAKTTYVAASASCPTVPAGLTCTPSGPAGALNTITWTIGGGSLAPNATVAVKFRATIN